MRTLNLRRPLAAALLLSLAGPLPACSDEEGPSNYIVRFAGANQEITEGTEIDLEVKLAQKATAITYVDVINDDYKDVLQVSYGTQATNKDVAIKYRINEQKQTVVVKGLKKGSGKITFQIRGTSSRQSFSVLVKELYNADSGAPNEAGAPDMTVMVDNGITPDTGTTLPDSGGITPDAATAD